MLIKIYMCVTLNNVSLNFTKTKTFIAPPPKKNNKPKQPISLGGRPLVDLLN